MTAVTAALGSVAAQLAASEAETTRVGGRIAALAEGISNYAKLSTNSVRVINALETDNVAELYAARAEHNDLVCAARARLGSAVVDENIRAAWTSVQGEWPVERFEARTAEMSSRVAARERNAEFRATLGIVLARQNELNNIVAQAEHSGRQVYGRDGVPMTPVLMRLVSNNGSSSKSWPPVERGGACGLRQICRQTRPGIEHVHAQIASAIMKHQISRQLCRTLAASVANLAARRRTMSV